MSKNKNETSDVLYEYMGVKVRRHNIIHLRVDEITYKKIIDIERETGLSIRKILGYSATPCKCCETSPVIAFNHGKEIRIERGIFSKRIPVSFSNKKRNHMNNRPVINTITNEVFDSVKEILKFVDITYNPLLDRLNNRVENNTPFKFLDEYDQSNRIGKENS